MLALCFIILGNLFTLVEMAENSRRRQSFHNISDAKETIAQYVKESYKRDGYVKIQWLGMTMFNVWSILTFALNELATEGIIRDLSIEVAMLNPEWLNSNSINPAWTADRASTTATSIDAYFLEKKADERFANWKHRIKFY